MKLQLDPSISLQAIPGTAPAGKSPPAVPATSGDGIRLSTASEALNRSPKIARLAVAVQGDAYQISGAATSSALVEDALSRHF
jgi:hypothetical protein